MKTNSILVAQECTGIAKKGPASHFVWCWAFGHCSGIFKIDRTNSVECILNLVNFCLKFIGLITSQHYFCSGKSNFAIMDDSLTNGSVQNRES